MILEDYPLILDAKIQQGQLTVNQITIGHITGTPFVMVSTGGATSALWKIGTPSWRQNIILILNPLDTPQPSS